MVIGLVRRGQMIQKKFPAAVHESGLLRSVDDFLRDQKIKLKGLKGIAAITGGEGFTSARLVVTLANTLSYALNIPARGIPLKKAHDCEFITAEFARGSGGRYVSAKYSAEARVSVGRPLLGGGR